MNIELTAEQKALQQEVREYMTTVMTPELLEEIKIPEYKEGGGPEFRKQYARMGADGWIGLSWSRELGGRELSHVQQYIFTDEVVRDVKASDAAYEAVAAHLSHRELSELLMTM